MSNRNHRAQRFQKSSLLFLFLRRDLSPAPDTTLKSEELFLTVLKITWELCFILSPKALKTVSLMAKPNRPIKQSQTDTSQSEAVMTLKKSQASKPDPTICNLTTEKRQNYQFGTRLWHLTCDNNNDILYIHWVGHLDLFYSTVCKLYQYSI